MTVAEPVLAAIDPALTRADVGAGCRCSRRPTGGSEPPTCRPRWSRAVVDDELLDSSGTLAVIVSRSRRDAVEAAVMRSEAARPRPPSATPTSRPSLFDR